MKRHSKETIIRICGDTIVNLSEVRFDLKHIDMLKKGWTRYYPFSIAGKDYIIRIFLTEESAYQPKTEVLFEGSVENPAVVTFQILDGVNAIIKDCRIKPHSFYPVSQADTSP